MPSTDRQCVAEFVGTCYLVATIIGSGMMGDNLSPDDGVALLGNTLATMGILFVLITIMGGISGAHFNPLVSICFFLKRELPLANTLLHIFFQFAGAITGAYAAHAMFMKRNGEFDGKDRDTDGEFFAEIVATIGLLMTIFGSLRAKAGVAFAVALFITAGYWFTSSTSFANPAVTVGRCFTDTFAGISPKSLKTYICGQLIGLLFGLPFCEYLFLDKSPLAAIAVLARHDPKGLKTLEDLPPIRGNATATTTTANAQGPGGAGTLEEEP